ncbi:MAG: hypothetical protein WCL14_14745 [Bacteroidota bacterium]
MIPFMNATSLLDLLNKWKAHLFTIGIITIIASIIFSGPTFIQPKYKSYAIIYPSNIIPYAGESPTEQMLQVLQSDDIRRDMFKKFNLAKHYDIDTSKDKYYMSHLIDSYNENVTFDRNEFQSVQVDVLDVDPFMAAAMVDTIIDLMNKKAKSLQREKSEEIVKILKIQLDRKKSEMDSMENVVKNLRTSYGIISYDNQAREITREYYQILGSRGNPQALTEAHQLMQNLQEHGGEFVSINEHLWRVRGMYNDIKSQYENAIKDVEKILTYSNIITSPYPADKKTYPIRWLIVVISTLSTVLLSFIVLGIIDRKKNSL